MLHWTAEHDSPFLRVMTQFSACSHICVEKASWWSLSATAGDSRGGCTAAWFKSRLKHWSLTIVALTEHHAAAFSRWLDSLNQAVVWSLNSDACRCGAWPLSLIIPCFFFLLILKMVCEVYSLPRCCSYAALFTMTPLKNKSVMIWLKSGSLLKSWLKSPQLPPNRTFWWWPFFQTLSHLTMFLFPIIHWLLFSLITHSY